MVGTQQQCGRVAKNRHRHVDLQIGRRFAPRRLHAAPDSTNGQTVAGKRSQLANDTVQSGGHWAIVGIH